jgi:hypothetical protein
MDITVSAPVFISSSSADRDTAIRICEAMERNGIACWIAPRDIAPGQNFMAAIVAAIRAAKVMILVFSAHTNESEEVQREIALAGQYRSMVVPVRIENVVPNDAFTYQFATRQWIDLFEDWDREIARLIASVEPVANTGPKPGTDERTAETVGAKPAPNAPAGSIHDVVPHIAPAKENAPPLTTRDEEPAVTPASRTPLIIGALLAALAVVRILTTANFVAQVPSSTYGNLSFALLSIAIPILISLAVGYAGITLLRVAKQPGPHPTVRTTALAICYILAGYQAFVFSMAASRISYWTVGTWLNFGLSTGIAIVAILMLWNWPTTPQSR